MTIRRLVYNPILSINKRVCYLTKMILLALSFQRKTFERQEHRWMCNFDNNRYIHWTIKYFLHCISFDTVPLKHKLTDPYDFSNTKPDFDEHRSKESIANILTQLSTESILIHRVNCIYMTTQKGTAHLLKFLNHTHPTNHSLLVPCSFIITKHYSIIQSLPNSINV